MKQHPKVMVCISTKQNTVNILPFLQFDMDLLILLETHYAAKQEWSKGIRAVVEDQGKKTLVYTIEEGTKLEEMLHRIRGIVDPYLRVCWNIGGGQKMQQLAFFRVFHERLEHGIADWACYADPQSRKMFKITGDRSNLLSSAVPLNVPIDLWIIIKIFGLEQQKNNTPRLLWERVAKDDASQQEASAYADTADFWNTSIRKKLTQWSFTHKGEKPTVLEGLKHGFPDYFERVVQFEVIKLLAENPESHCVNEAWANVRVKDKRGVEIAEWDVVLVTDFGTLIILDAKTGQFGQKDEDARLYNLERATGVYGQFWLVIPYMKEDMDDEAFWTAFGDKGKEARLQPFKLNELKSKLLAVTGQSHSVFIQKGRKNKVKIISAAQAQETKDEKTMELLDIKMLLETLHLKRMDNQ